MNLDVEWMFTDDGGARHTPKASRGRIYKLCHSTSTASAHYGVTVVWRDMHAHVRDVENTTGAKGHALDV